MTASETTRGTVDRATNVGNPGVLIGTQDVGGQPYARYRATNGTWVSASLQEQGYAALYGRNTGYGAYTGLVRSSDGTPLSNPDRIRPGQEYLVPIVRAAQPAPGRTEASPRTHELFAEAEAPRGIDDRYGGSQPVPRTQLKVSAAQLPIPIAGAAAYALARAAAPAEGAEALAFEGASWEAAAFEEVSAGALLAGPKPPLSPWLLPVAAWGWAAYEWYGVYREWKSLQQARADARDLARQSQEGVRRLLQNDVITYEEYLNYLNTGHLVIQDGPRPGETGAEYERRIFRDTPLAPASKTYQGWRGGTNGSLRTWWNSVKRRLGADAQARAKRVLAISGNEFVDKFGSKQLQSRWAERQKIRDETAKDLAEERKRLSEARKDSREHKQASSRVDELTKRLDEINSAESRAIGDLRPDQIELFFEEMRALVTDITLKLHDPWHELKSLLYRDVVREITGYHVDAIEFRTALQQVLLPSDNPQVSLMPEVAGGSAGQPPRPPSLRAPQESDAPDAGFAPIR
jgi:hypothetical protein